MENMTTQTLDSHIDVTPGVCSGKPRIAGHRITVQNIVIEQRLGRTVDEIAVEYNLSLADVHAALAYYHDHRAEIDASIERDREFVDALQRSSTSKVLEKLQALKDHAGEN